MLLKGIVVSLFAAASLAVAACGGSDDKPASNTSSTNSTTAGADTPAQVIDLVALENGQAYLFDKTELKVKPGKVTLRLTNKPDSQRPHTFDLKTKDGSDDIVKSDRAEPGKMIEISFTVTETGTYNFLCLLPGHADRGQKGTLIVAN